MKKSIKEIMNILSKNNCIFQNEQQFQFELAEEISKHCSSSEKVIFELVSMKEKKEKRAKKFFSDIIIKDKNGSYTVIELKYKTKKSKYNRQDFGDIELAEQGATDLGRYDYLWDIKRIELLKKQNNSYIYNQELKNFKEGYAIILTNDHNYWDMDKGTATNKKCSYQNLCISSKDSITRNTPMGFPSKNPKTSKQMGKPFKSRKNIEFDNNYSFDWQDYGTNSSIKPRFKYLITKI